MRRRGSGLRGGFAALAGFVLALGGVLVATSPAHAADFPDVDTEAELNAAIQFAIDNPADPVMIDITGDVPIAVGITHLTAGSVTVAGNGHTISAISVSDAGFHASNASHLAIDSLTFDFYESGPVLSSEGTPGDPGASPTVAVSGVTATAGAFDVAFEIEDTAFSMSTTVIHDSEVGFAGVFSFGTTSLQNVTVLDTVDCGIDASLTENAMLVVDHVTIERSGCEALWINASDSASATVTNTLVRDSDAGIVIFNLGTGTIEVRDSAMIGSTVAEQLAIIAFAGTVQVTNATISGSLDTGLPVVSAMFEDANVIIEHSTLTDNAVSTAPVLEVSGCGCVGAGSFVLSHSIIAGNAGTGALAPDLLLDIDPAMPRTIDWSLIGTVDPADTATLDAIAAGAGNLFDAGTAIDPDLGALALNGGTTPNHLPVTTSPTVNSGDPAFASPPATDQRGSARISGGIVDIGSVEVQFTPTLTLSRTTSASGEQITATGSGYPADTEFTMVLNSTPVTLGVATTTAGGALSFSFTVPTSVPAGAHTITATLAGNVVASAALTVTGLPDTGDTGDTGSGLAFAGVVLLLAGVAIVALRRRRA